jgi:hypothetical protein
VIAIRIKVERRFAQGIEAKPSDQHGDNQIAQPCECLLIKALQRLLVQHGGRLEPVLPLELLDSGSCLGPYAPVDRTVIKTFRLQLVLSDLYGIRGEVWRFGLIGGPSGHRLLHP